MACAPGGEDYSMEQEHCGAARRSVQTGSDMTLPCLFFRYAHMFILETSANALKPTNAAQAGLWGTTLPSCTTGLRVWR